MNTRQLMQVPVLALIAASVALSGPSASAMGRHKQKNTGTRTYAGVKTFIHNLAAQHPANAQIFQLGMSDAGEMIEGLKLGNGAIHNVLVSTHHGNEYGATEVALAFAQSLAESPIPGQTLYVIPVLNISGYNHLDRRETANGTTFDPNRDYPGPCGTEGPFHLKSTAALAKLIASENIVASTTLHTFYPVVAYPWGFGTQDLATAYDDLFIQLAKSAVVESKYPVGNSTAAIYPAAGAYEDYAFWKHGIWSMLFELGYSHTPGEADVSELIRVNVPGLRSYYLNAPTARADNHDFTGHCDTKSYKFDRHDE